MNTLFEARVLTWNNQSVLLHVLSNVQIEIQNSSDVLSILFYGIVAKSPAI